MFLLNSIDDIQIFVDKIIYILIIKYWRMNQSLNSRNDLKIFENFLFKKILNFIFENGIYLLLLNNYKIQKELKLKDDLFLKQLYEFIGQEGFLKKLNFFFLNQ